MTDLGIIKKNGREEIRITAENFKGHDLINIRVWFDDGTGTMRPGKQGMAFRLDLLPTVMETLGKASKSGAA
ncbi:transcriptional coactivator p15/PC4 family protein [Paracoccus aminovorans]|uniref:transcriptional coactivator p15/PC4 family protein n=1 Tax=Paracoccus aminovorans TaxID=34004 RepID=UPI0007805930|nr:transcriptional coactivator p15/PC4 family protein [Paracoccus aminovorans]